MSELYTMTRLSWVALQGMAHSFIELDKAATYGFLTLQWCESDIRSVDTQTLKSEFFSFSRLTMYGLMLS